MRRSLAALALAATLLSVTATGSLAAAKTAVVQLHPPMHSHMMSIAHSKGSARISYTAHDATINLTTQKLPTPKSLHGNVYVLWLVTGKQKTNAGSFSVHNGMGALHAMVMQTMFSRLVVTAEKSMHGMHPMGTQVLLGSVPHH